MLGPLGGLIAVAMLITALGRRKALLAVGWIVVYVVVAVLLTRWGYV